MNSETVDQILLMIEDTANSKPSASEFEMAYQSRVAIDRIRFAIRVTEQTADQPEQLREASFQLLDALGRLETAERNFQRRFRSSSRHGTSESADHRVNGTVAGGDRRKAFSRA
jgi:hypothetical protein